MPNGSGDDTGESHRQHEFPGDIHHLIDACAWECSADPDVNKKQRAQFYEEPHVGGNNFEHARRRMPAAQKQSRGKPADGEHPNVFSHKKYGVFES